jgi:hypothetical protein
MAGFLDGDGRSHARELLARKTDLTGALAYVISRFGRSFKTEKATSDDVR